MASDPMYTRSILPPSYREGLFIKELDELKELCQRTAEETKACCGAHQSRAQPAPDTSNPVPRPAEEAHCEHGESPDNGMLQCVVRKAKEVLRFVEERKVETSTTTNNSTNAGIPMYTALRQVINDDHKKLIGTIHNVNEDLLEQKRRQHAELLNTLDGIRKQRAQPSRR